jgi:hypothetical protein
MSCSQCKHITGNASQDHRSPSLPPWKNERWMLGIKGMIQIRSIIYLVVNWKTGRWFMGGVGVVSRDRKAKVDFVLRKEVVGNSI